MNRKPNTSGILHANVEFAAPPEPPEQTPRRALILMSLLVATLLLAIVGVAIASHSVDRPIRAASAPIAPLDTSAAETPAGSAIVETNCLEVGAHACLDADPRLHAAVQLLQTTARGATLVRTAAGAGVFVRVGTPTAGAIAFFRPRTRTVTIGEGLAHSTTRAQAAVLAHELQHVADWTKVGPMFGNAFNCYQTEASAFTTEAAVWRELQGVQPAANSFESRIEAIARGVDSGKPNFWLGLASDYAEECVGV